MFVRFDDPIQLRREILTSSKDVVEILQGFEKFKISRIKKIELIVKYKEIMGEINILSGKLRKILPKVDKGMIKKPVVRVEVRAKPAEVPKDRDKLRDLDVELQDIESKLNSLS
jgi:hypothetical protein